MNWPVSRRPRILLAASGSVATVKLPQLCELLSELGDVKVVSTAAAQHFLATVRLPPGVAVLNDTAEWRDWQAVGDEVLHIELRRWADVLVVAPLSANTLAKVAMGLCDNLLTCVIRAWDWTEAPLLVAPAMNTVMWLSPFTEQHLSVLRGLGAVVIEPISKKLACGDVGLGAMAAPQVIVEAVRQQLLAPQSSAAHSKGPQVQRKGQQQQGEGQRQQQGERQGQLGERHHGEGQQEQLGEGQGQLGERQGQQGERQGQQGEGQSQQGVGHGQQGKGQQQQLRASRDGAGGQQGLQGGQAGASMKQRLKRWLGPVQGAAVQLLCMGAVWVLGSRHGKQTAYRD